MSVHPVNPQNIYEPKIISRDHDQVFPYLLVVEHFFLTCFSWVSVLECQVEENEKKIQQLLGTPCGIVYRTR